MPRLKSYGVFISHAWDYNTDYYRLERMLKKAKHFKWRNCSVPEHDKLNTRSDAQLERALRNQIRPANVVAIIAGMYVNNRKWIQKEINNLNYILNKSSTFEREHLGQILKKLGIQDL